MGNIVCCTREKNAPTEPTQAEKDLEALLASNPSEIIVSTVDEANLLFEKNTVKNDFVLKFSFNSQDEPYFFFKMITNFQYSHIYKKISFELGPFFSKENAELLITALQSMNALEFLELKLGENSDLEDNFMNSLATLVNNSICFNLKEFRLEVSKSRITNANSLVKALIARESLERLTLKLRQNNLNDEDFEVIASLLTKKSLKHLDLDLHDNNGHEKAAKAFIKVIGENNTVESGSLVFTSNKFSKSDKNELVHALELKKNVLKLYI